MISLCEYQNEFMQRPLALWRISKRWCYRALDSRRFFFRNVAAALYLDFGEFSSSSSWWMIGRHPGLSIGRLRAFRGMALSKYIRKSEDGPRWFFCSSAFLSSSFVIDTETRIELLGREKKCPDICIILRIILGSLLDTNPAKVPVFQLSKFPQFFSLNSMWRQGEASASPKKTQVGGFNPLEKDGTSKWVHLPQGTGWK